MNRHLLPCLLLVATALTPQLALADDTTDPVMETMKACRAAYDKDDMKAAAPCFARIVADHPKHRIAPYAAEMHLDALNQQQDYGALLTAASHYLKGPLASDDRLSRKLRKIQESLAFRECDEVSRTQKHGQAAECYLDYTASYPTSQYGDKALYNAAIHYEQAKQADKAIMAYQRLINAYPHSELAVKSAFSVGMALANNGREKEAAEAFERYVAKFKQAEKASEALLNAIALRDKLGDKAAAIRNITLFTKLYPKSERAPNIVLHLGKLHIDAGQPDEAIHVYGRFLKFYGRSDKARSVIAHAAIGRILLNQGRSKKAIEAYERAFKIFDHLQDRDDKSRAQEAAGEALFRLADAKAKRIPKLKPSLPTEKLAKSLTAKAKAFREVEQAYMRTIEVKNTLWSTAALSRIGDLYMDFVEELHNLPPPKGLDTAERDAYIGVISDYTQPIEEKALQAYAMCVRIAATTNIDNAYVKHAREAMCKMQDCP